MQNVIRFPIERTKNYIQKKFMKNIEIMDIIENGLVEVLAVYALDENDQLRVFGAARDIELVEEVIRDDGQESDNDNTAKS
jgi:hypothetical protein